jgi:hypothetical protein
MQMVVRLSSTTIMKEMKLISRTVLTGSTVTHSTIRSTGIPGIMIHSILRIIRGDIMTITGQAVHSGLDTADLV